MPNLTTPDMGLIDDLTNLSAKLNQQSGEVNKILSDLEKKLVAMGFGFEVTLHRYGRDELGSRQFRDLKAGETFKEVLVLGFGRIDNQWALLIRGDVSRRIFSEGDGYWEYDHELRPMRLLQGSRDLRIAALDKIEGLLEAVQNKIESTMESTEKARKIVDKL